MVASSTIISCAVAMTNSATPRWRRLLSVPVWPAVESVVVMPPMLPTRGLAVVPPANRLPPAQLGCDDRPDYSRGSSWKWVRRADTAEDRGARRLGECVRIAVGRGFTRPDGSSRPASWSWRLASGGCTCARWSSAPRRRSGRGRKSPAEGGRGAAADRPRAARFPHPQHLRHLRSVRRGGAPGAQARRGGVARAAGDPGGERGRRAGTAHDARRAAQRRRRRQQRPRPPGPAGGAGARGRSPGDGERDRRRADAAARGGPGRLPDRAGSAHQRQPPRRPGLRLGSPLLHVDALEIQVDDDGAGISAQQHHKQRQQQRNGQRQRPQRPPASASSACANG